MFWTHLSFNLFELSESVLILIISFCEFDGCVWFLIFKISTQSDGIADLIIVYALLPCLLSTPIGYYVICFKAFIFYIPYIMNCLKTRPAEYIKP